MKEGVYAINSQDELPEVMAFLLRAPTELPGFALATCPVNIDKVARAILTCFLNEQIFVYRNKLNKIIGAILLHESSVWWTDETLISDLTFFVDKTVQDTSIAEALLLATLQYGKMKKKRVIINTYTTERIPALAKYYNKLGFDLNGITVISKEES